MSLAMTMSPLRYLFPLDHKKLMFIVMFMFMIVMSQVGTKPSGLKPTHQTLTYYDRGRAREE